MQPEVEPEPEPEEEPEPEPEPEPEEHEKLVEHPTAAAVVAVVQSQQDFGDLIFSQIVTQNICI